MKLGELYTELRVNNAQFRRGLQDAKKSVGGLESSMKRLQKFALGFLGAGAALMAMRRLVRVVDEEQRSVAKLNAVLKATGGAAELSAAQMRAHAAALQTLTGVSDDAIVNMQAILATFKLIKGDIFKRATQAVMDMSNVLGQDLRSSAVQLGKALNDPILGVTALRRVGVQLTRQQEEMIDKFMEVGDVAAAQNIILKEVESQMGDAAKAAGQTLGGELGKLWGTISDVAQRLGGVLTPVVAEFNRTLGITQREASAAERAIQGLAAAGKMVREFGGGPTGPRPLPTLPRGDTEQDVKSLTAEIQATETALIAATAKAHDESNESRIADLKKMHALETQLLYLRLRAAILSKDEAKNARVLAESEALRVRQQRQLAALLGAAALPPELQFPAAAITLEGEGPDTGLLDRISDYKTPARKAARAQRGMAGTAGIADFAREMQRAITQGQMDRIAQDQLKEARLHTEILRELVSQGPGMAPLN